MLTKDELLAIDLTEYDELATYPAGIDWPSERKKVLFLQTAVRLGLDWAEIARRTLPHFGPTLKPPFEPEVVPLPIPAFDPPSFDVARQTPAQWARGADEKWHEYRDDVVDQISKQVKALRDQGVLKPFEPTRKHSGISGLRKEAIAEEQVAFQWAVLSFFGVSWADIAKRFPSAKGWPKNPLEAAQSKRRRADQIRKRVEPILKDLGLPRR